MSTFLTDSLSVNRVRAVGEDALNIKNAGYHCSETLIRAVWPYVLPGHELSDDVLRVVMPFRGGMAGTTSSHCGGLTIGIAMAGAIYGRVDASGDAFLATSIARRYWQHFLEEFDTSNCTLLRRNEPGPEAPTICGCIIVRSARLMVAYFDWLKKTQPTVEEMYAWSVDRSQEECHERVTPLRMDEVEYSRPQQP
jgi:hypothetical protein